MPLTFSLPISSPSVLPVRSLSMETYSGTFSRWSFHAPPHPTSSRSAWSCRSFSLSNSTPASGLSPPGALAPTCPRKPPSSTLRKELQSCVSQPSSVLLLGEIFNADCGALQVSHTVAPLIGSKMICNSNKLNLYTAFSNSWQGGWATECNRTCSWDH